MSKDSETNETINISDDIATFEAGRNAQFSAKNISEKDKN